MSNKEDEFKSLLQKWLENPDDWKVTILGLASYIDDPYVSPNAKAGFNLLIGSVFGAQCRKCDDWNAWNWLYAYANAYLENKELPLFDVGCLSENCSEVKKNP